MIYSGASSVVALELVIEDGRCLNLAVSRRSVRVLFTSDSAGAWSDDTCQKHFDKQLQLVNCKSAVPCYQVSC